PQGTGCLGQRRGRRDLEVRRAPHGCAHTAPDVHDIRRAAERAHGGATAGRTQAAPDKTGRAHTSGHPVALAAGAEERGQEDAGETAGSGREANREATGLQAGEAAPLEPTCSLRSKRQSPTSARGTSSSSSTTQTARTKATSSSPRSASRRRSSTSWRHTGAA